MKVLMINGGPHKEGCTNRALLEIANVLHEEGIETEIVHTGLSKIQGCLGCGMCKRNKLGRCIIGEDPVNVVLKKLEEADGLIVGSPVHYAGACGSIKALLDRVFYAGRGNEYKPAAAIVTLRRAGAMPALDQLNNYFLVGNMPVVPSSYWNMVYGNTPEEIEQDVEGMRVMRDVGRNMAWMLKLMENGKKQGIERPESEKRKYMNFIR